MVGILTPSSIWIQLASMCFFLSGLHGDLMVIRFFLFLAYLCMGINAALGSPPWPKVSGSEGAISVDSLVWASLSLYVNGYSLMRLLLDERKVPLGEDEAALWRLMYRTGGLSQRLFQTIVARHLQIVEFSPGQDIPTDEYFYVIYHGQVDLQVFENNHHKLDRRLVSGEMFDLKYLGMFAGPSVFEHHIIRCTSVARTKLFRIPRDAMQKIAHNPLAKSVWQALLINNLSFVVESYSAENCRSRLAEQSCGKIFLPLEPWEQPKQMLAGSGRALDNAVTHVAAYIQSSFSPPWPFAGHPTGIRQTQLPLPAPRLSPAKQDPPRFHRVRSVSFMIPPHISRRFPSLKATGSRSITDENENNDVEGSEVSC
jgi:hypothetical protein